MMPVRSLLVRVGCAALFGSLITVTSVAAQTQTQTPPKVCMDEPAFRQFDFWVGEWDVYDNANGNLAGRDRIESRENGCVLVEHWTSSSGGTGMSMNYYDTPPAGAARSGARATTPSTSRAV